MLSILGFILAIVVVIYGVFKQWNFIFMSLVGTLIVVVTNGMPFADSFLGTEASFVNGMGGFIADYFILFLLSAIFAMYIDQSGAAESIANWVLKITGTDKPYLILVSIYAIGAILTIGGISTFVVLFVVIPLARTIFKRMNIPWHLVMTPYFMGIGTWTVTTLPGSAQVQNVIVGQSMGTPLTSAPIPSILATLVFIGWALYRMKVELDQAEGMVFEERYDTTTNEEHVDRPLPPITLSLIPLIVLIGTIIVGTALDIEYNLYLGMLGANILSILFFHKYLPNHRDVISSGVQNSISTTVLPAAAVGFGQVLAASNGLKYAIDAIQTLPVAPILLLSLITFLIAYAIGTASGALGIVTSSFLHQFNLAGVNPEVIHRLLVISAVNYAPQNNAVLTFYQVSGLNHASTYRNFNIAIHGGIVLAFFTAYISSMILY